jgi:hypothetical protein
MVLYIMKTTVGDKKSGAVDRYYLFLLSAYARIKSGGVPNLSKLCGEHGISSYAPKFMSRLKLIEKTNNTKPYGYIWVANEPTKEMAQELVSATSASVERRASDLEVQVSRGNIDTILKKLERIEKLVAKFVQELGVVVE